MEIKKYRKKPIEIEAVLWDGSPEAIENIKSLSDARKITMPRNMSGDLFIETLEGTMKANKGDYIIKGISGELYPCKPDIFKETYEEAK